MTEVAVATYQGRFQARQVPQDRRSHRPRVLVPARRPCRQRRSQSVLTDQPPRRTAEEVTSCRETRAVEPAEEERAVASSSLTQRSAA